jgi:hypothetical protein
VPGRVRALTTASFTGLARFTVRHGTGKYAGATGSGLATFIRIDGIGIVGAGLQAATG